MLRAPWDTHRSGATAIYLGLLQETRASTTVCAYTLILAIFLFRPLNRATRSAILDLQHSCLQYWHLAFSIHRQPGLPDHLLSLWFPFAVDFACEERGRSSTSHSLLVRTLQQESDALVVHFCTYV